MLNEYSQGYLLSDVNLIFNFDSTKTSVYLEHFVLSIFAAAPAIDVDVDVGSVSYEIVHNATRISITYLVWVWTSISAKNESFTICWNFVKSTYT